MIQPDMDPAVSEERLRREIMDRVYRLCELWWEKPAEGLRRTVGRRLQETLFKFPWLVDDLNPIVMDFLLSTLHLHSPPQAAHQPRQLVDSKPDTPAPTSTRRRRLRRQRSSPQPNPRTSQEPAVVSNTDIFSFPSPSVCVSAVDNDAAVSHPTAQVTSPRSEVSTPLAASPSAVVAPLSSHPPAVTLLPSSSPAATSPLGPVLPEQELSEPEQLPEELRKPEPLREPELLLEELREPEPPPLLEELNELEGPALPAEELDQREEPVLPAEDLGKPVGPAKPKLEVSELELELSEQEQELREREEPVPPAAKPCEPEH
ncbi:uncharacterized protein KIAA0754-like isoform X2 [Oreochromis aureus]|nr:uncharacterized protein KIAA0754-like isoform X2 [Oreochromis aureus]